MRGLKSILGASLLIGVGIADSSRATTIYNDTFNRTGDLNGSTPAPTDTGNAKWVSAAGAFTANSGSVSVAGPNGGGNSGNNASLPVTLATSTAYTLSVTITPTANSSNSDWLAVGFGTLNTTTGAIENADNDQVWVLYRESGGTATFYGGGTNNPVVGNTATVAGSADTFTITLNTSTDAFSITDSQGLVNRSNTLTSAEVSSIAYLNLGALNTAGGAFSNLQLTSTPTPEPGPLAFVGLAGLGFLRRRRAV